jgi:3-deoxy-D-manno-octulosonic-acid transferase
MYSFGIFLYGLTIRLASLFNAKARQWQAGRKNLFRHIEQALIQVPSEKRIWIHASSLGEFEQGRPLIEALKQNFPQYAIVLTFFSPSGYEVQKNYKYADFVFYLPLDTKRNAQRFLDLVQPELAIFVKYEFWLNFLFALKLRHIPTVLISAVFRPNQLFFNRYISFYRNALSAFSHFFVQNEMSKKLLQDIGYQNVTISGDTRFDRVFDIAQDDFRLDTLTSFVNNKKTIIAGSSWPHDEDLLARYAKQRSDIKWIIAPHEVTPSHIKQIKTLFADKKTLLYSEISSVTNLADYDLLIVDTIGLLNKIYRYGTIAYIGGGFGKGIHNILEPAVFGLPVLFGPRYQKFEEATQLILLGGACSITNYSTLETQLNQWLDDTEKYETASLSTTQFVQRQIGAVKTIMEYLFSSKLLK